MTTRTTEQKQDDDEKLAQEWAKELRKAWKDWGKTCPEAWRKALEIAYPGIA